MEIIIHKSDNYEAFEEENEKITSHRGVIFLMLAIIATIWICCFFQIFQATNANERNLKTEDPDLIRIQSHGAISQIDCRVAAEGYENMNLESRQFWRFQFAMWGGEIGDGEIGGKLKPVHFKTLNKFGRELNAHVIVRENHGGEVSVVDPAFGFQITEEGKTFETTMAIYFKKVIIP